MNEGFLNRYGIYIIFVLALIPVLAFRDMTPANELRYVSIASDALRDGNIFTFTNQGHIYTDKPPLYLWIVMLAYAIAGVKCGWIVELFSVIPAIITTELTIAMCGTRLPNRRRNAVRIMTLTSVMFLTMSFTMRMDMLMTMFIVMAIYYIMRIYRHEGDLRSNQWLVGVGVFMALFTKGPVGVLVPLVSLVLFLIYVGEIGYFGRYWGWRCWLVIIAGCALWWGVALWEGGMAYINDLLFHQTVDRAVDAFHHKRPWFYYLVQMWWCFAPWSLYLVATLADRLVRRGRGAVSAEELMCLIVVVSTFVMLSVFSSKLPVYLLPVTSFWVCASIMITEPKGALWQRWLVALPAIALCLAGAAIALGLWIPNKYAALLPALDAQSMLIVTIMGVVLCLSSLMAVITLTGSSPWFDAGVKWLGCGMLGTLFLAGLVLPSFNYMVGLADIADVGVRAQSEIHASRIATLRMKRSENMDVYFGEPVDALNNETALAEYLEDPRDVLLICRNNRDLSWIDRKDMRLVKEAGDKSVYYIPERRIMPVTIPYALENGSGTITENNETNDKTDE